MKRFTVILSLILSLFLVPKAYAVGLDFTPPLTLLSAVTTPAVGSAVNIGFVTSKITCHIVASGTAATSLTVSLLGSIDGTTYGTLYLNGTATTITFTIADATTNSFSVMNQPVLYLKGQYVSKVGGGAGTAVTLVCGAGGN